MKSRRRYSTSESEGSAASAESASDSEPSSESEGSDSLIGERERREKKHKRRAPSSGSASEEETRRRAKKRKHKKKKKKHGKKRRRNESASEEEEASESEGETKREILARANRNKHSYKNKSQSRSPSVQEVPERADRKEVRGGVRLQSVVKERRRLASSPRVSPPSPEPHRYYDRPKEREYVRSASEGEYDGRRREEEVERFYRGSSKDRSQRSGQPRYQPETRYEEPERYDRYGGGGHNNGGGHEHYSRTNRSRDHGQYSNRGDRQPRYESRRGEDEYAREEHYRPHRDREFVPRHQPFHQHDDRGERPPRHFADKSGPVCLVCDEAHAGRECRRRPDRFRQPERDGRRDDRRGERRDVRREERRDERPEERPHDDKHVVVKREREERPSRGERDERGRVSRERREVSRGGSPARSPARREPRARSEAERPVKRERASPPAPPPRQRQRATRFNEEDGGEFTWGKTEVKAEAAPADKAKPDFALSGKLAADTNMVNGILLKYSEPPDAKQPKRKWRFYPFKGDKALPILYIHRQSCFVLGREHKAVDIPLEHPSVSKQHAALQYRATPYTRPDGTQARRVRPYIIDLDSANGTFVNNKKIETRRYVELLERDVVKFGFSQREYVLLHENSKDDGDDDNQEMGAAPAVGAAVTSIATVKREKQIKQEAREDGE